MANVSEQTELLICRALDGELNADERLQLDRELLRCPDARKMFEEYQRIDRMAVTAIDSAVRPATPTPELRLTGSGRRSHGRSGWMFAVSALAACLAFVLFLATPEERDANPHRPAAEATHHPMPSVPATGKATLPMVGENFGDVGVWRVSDRPQSVNRQTDRKYLMLTGDDGRIYVVPVDHVREIRRDDLRQDERAVLDPV